MAKKEEAKLEGVADSIQETKTPEKIARKVTPGAPLNFKGVDFLWNRYGITTDQNTRPEDLLDPKYWAHLSAQLRPRDEIVAWSHDGTWRAEYVVLGSDRNWAKVVMVGQPLMLTTADVSQTQAELLNIYEVKWGGPSALWQVIRRADQSLMKDGLADALIAQEWVRERLKSER